MSDPLPHPTPADLRPEDGSPRPEAGLQRRHIIALIAFGAALLVMLAVITGIQIGNADNHGIKASAVLDRDGDTDRIIIEAAIAQMDSAEMDSLCKTVRVVDDGALLSLVEMAMADSDTNGTFDADVAADVLREACA